MPRHEYWVLLVVLVVVLVLTNLVLAALILLPAQSSGALRPSNEDEQVASAPEK